MWPPEAISARNGGSKRAGREVRGGDVAVRGGRPARTAARARRRSPWRRRSRRAARRPGRGRASPRPASTSSSARAGASERLVDHGVDQLEVVARGDLGHDAAEAGVHLLRGDHVRARSSPSRADERGAGVVAARLEREDHGRWWATGSAAGTSSRRPSQRRRRAPHDQRVLAVVLVVAPAHAGDAEAVALVERDRRLVGAAHLERELGARRRRAGRAAASSAEAMPWRRSVGVDGDVHHVPDGVVARADRVARRAAVAERREAEAGRLGELEHEHRERPRRREGAPLDRGHRRQVAVGEGADLERRAARSSCRRRARSRVGDAAGSPGPRRSGALRAREAADRRRADPVQRAFGRRDGDAAGLEQSRKRSAPSPTASACGPPAAASIRRARAGAADARREQLHDHRGRRRRTPRRGGRRARPPRRGRRAVRASARSVPTPTSARPGRAREAARGREADPQAGVAARADADGDQVDLRPADAAPRPAARRRARAARSVWRATRTAADVVARLSSGAVAAQRKRDRRRGRRGVEPEDDHRAHLDRAGDRRRRCVERDRQPRLRRASPSPSARPFDERDRGRARGSRASRSGSSPARPSRR